MATSDLIPAVIAQTWFCRSSAGPMIAHLLAITLRAAANGVPPAWLHSTKQRKISGTLEETQLSKLA